MRRKKALAAMRLSMTPTSPPRGFYCLAREEAIFVGWFADAWRSCRSYCLIPKRDILPMPGLGVDTGKTHEAAGFHIAYWQRGRRMAACGARPGSSAKAASHRLSSGSDIAKREIRHVCAGPAGARVYRRP